MCVPIEKEFDTYRAIVTPIIAPDYSRKRLLMLLEDAQERIFSQQLYVEYDWTEGGDNPLTIMRDAGSRGVDSRILVDVTYDNPLDTDFKDGYGLYTYYEDDEFLKVKYEDSRQFSMAHNKGVICDDMVMIGSMNWTETSICSNREVSIVIESKEVADIYAELFLNDWGREFDGNVFLEVNVPDARKIICLWSIWVMHLTHTLYIIRIWADGVSLFWLLLTRRRVRMCICTNVRNMRILSRMWSLGMRMPCSCFLLIRMGTSR